MNKTLVIAGGTLIIALVVSVSIFLYVKTLNPKDTSVPGQQPFGFVSTAEPSAQRPVPVVLVDNSTVYVPDFFSSVQPEWANETTKAVLGSDADAFMVVYFTPDHEGGQGQFIVSINTEPFGDTRKRAEVALQNKLGLTNEELCKLSVVVSTNPGANNLYKGQNLGFSFCPGAIVLP